MLYSIKKARLLNEPFFIWLNNFISLDIVRLKYVYSF